MNKGLYLPQSDCECYYQALDLLNDALDEALDPIEQDIESNTERIEALEQQETESNYIYLNEWLADNACAGYPQSQSDLVDLIDSGKKLVYFSVQDGNLYVSNGEYEYDGGVPRIYFSIFHSCDSESNKAEAYLGTEFSFNIIDSFYDYMRIVPMNVDTNMSFSGFTPPANAVGVIVGISGIKIKPEQVYLMGKSGYTPALLWPGADFGSFITFVSGGSFDDGDEWNFIYNGEWKTNHNTFPYMQIVEYLFDGISQKVLVVIDETTL